MKCEFKVTVHYGWSISVEMQHVLANPEQVQIQNISKLTPGKLRKTSPTCCTVDQVEPFAQ